MEKKIKSVEKGWGKNSTFFTTDEGAKKFPHYVDEIKEEYEHQCPYPMLKGFKDGNLIFKMGLSIDVTVIYKYE